MVSALEELLRRDRVIVCGALALLTLLTWLAIFLGAGTGMSTLGMTTWQFPPPRPAMIISGEWSPAYWLTILLMWWVMMTAMMVPSAAPMILLYARVVRQREGSGQIRGALTPTAVFAAGYLVCWLGFSAAATMLQFALERSGLIDGMMMWSTERRLTAGLLLAAGLYQLSPVKMACLAQCRSPAEFLARHWRPGRTGAFRLGLEHGAYCLGCCWALMLLLFAAGIMNLVWIVGLSALVLAEKLAPVGGALAKAIAVLLLVGAAALVAPTFVIG
jgi:predicted metal-binding membrane protein